jgi:mRNA-degrading endonuclease toxin of MazEF toxin-antitoxin module
MSELRRGWVVDVDLEPTKGSETGKIRPNTVRLRKKCKIFQRENEMFSF